MEKNFSPNPTPSRKHKHNTRPRSKSCFIGEIKIMHGISISKNNVRSLNRQPPPRPGCRLIPPQCAQFCRCFSGASAHSFYTAVFSAVPSLFIRCRRAAASCDQHTRGVEELDALLISISFKTVFCIEPSINVLV